MLWWNYGNDAHPDKLIQRAADHLEGRGVGINEHAIGVHHEHGVHGILEYGSKPSFTCAQSFFRPFALGNVAYDHLYTAAIQEQLCAGLHRKYGAIFTPQQALT